MDPEKTVMEETIDSEANPEEAVNDEGTLTEQKRTFLRASGGLTDFFPIAVLLSLLLMILGNVISRLLDHYIIPVQQIGMNLLGDADAVPFLLQYFEFFGIWIAFLIVLLLFRNNRPMWKAFFYNGHGNNLRAILIGILLGGGMNGTCILLSWLTGDIKLSFNGFAPLPFFTFLLCVMIQSGAEEIVDRCYLYQKLRRRYRWPVIAVLVNSLIFMALHMMNPGVTKLGLLQVFLIGVLFSLIVYYWDSLWTVIWAHTAWNFSQSIVFGLPNSGIVSKYSVFKLEAASARDGIFYNTSFGVEGSLGANVIIGAAIVIVLIWGFAGKRGEKKDHWEDLEKRYAGRKRIWEAVILAVIIALFVALESWGAKFVTEHREELQQALEQAMEMQQEKEREQQEQQDGQVPADKADTVNTGN